MIWEEDCVGTVPSRRQSCLTVSSEIDVMGYPLVVHTMWTCHFTPNYSDLCTSDFPVCAIDKGHFLALVEAVKTLMVSRI